MMRIVVNDGKYCFLAVDLHLLYTFEIAVTRSRPFNVAHAATCICHVEFCVAVCFSFSLTIHGRKFGSVSQSVSLLQTISKLCLKQKLVHKCFLTQSQRIPNGVYNYTFTSLWP